MSRRTIGTLLLALSSLILGIGAAEAFFRLMRGTVPPALLGSFQLGAAHAAFLMYGFLLAAIVFGFVLSVLALVPLFRRRKDPSDAPSPVSPPPGR